MAKLGRTTARWEGITSGVRTEIALRRDGVLLRKTTHLNGDGSVDWSDGWKIETRRPKQDVGSILCRRGFQRIYR